jgi:large subunit ribosomal protein L13e
VNVQRLKAYKARLILFPRKAGQVKQGDASVEDVKAAKGIRSTKVAMPIVGVSKEFREVAKSEMPAAVEGGAYRKLRDARSEARQIGKRAKRAQDKAAEADAAKK